MHFKVVVENQTRIFDCKEPLTLEALRAYVKKLFPYYSQFSFYYIDEDGDQIILETKDDINVYLEISSKKPKIYVKKDQSQAEVFDVSHIVKKKTEDIQKGQEKEEKKPILFKAEDKIAEPETKIKKEQIPVENAIQEKQNIKVPQGKSEDDKPSPLLVQDELRASENDKSKSEQRQREQKMIDEKIQKKEVELRYESLEERLLVIMSLLENIFGSEYQQYYKEFARQTTENTEEKVCESFLHWIVLKKQSSENNSIMTWVKKFLQKLSNKVVNPISFSYD